MSTNRRKPIVPKDIPVMFFDGEFQGDLLQGVAAAILLMPNGRRYTVSQLVSVNHKDEAEYTALIIGLKKAQKLGLNALAIKGDSDLIFNQVNGLTPVTQERLIKLYRIAIKLIRSFEKTSLEWISSEQNRPAKSALKRCINDALGRKKNQKPSLTAIPSSQDCGIIRLIEKGEQATDEEYLQLTIESDQWSDKSLSELRALIPVEVRDIIALQWQGDEENLAQMYRWHLRGLPPKMACRKVNIDYKTDQEAKIKLPWEEALNLPQPILTDSDETSDSLVSLLSALDEAEESVEAFSLEPSESNLTKSLLFETLLEANVQDNEFIEKKASLFSTDTLPGNKESNLSLDKENIETKIDVSEDKLPSESSIVHILKLIENLTAEEQMTLAKKLVKIPKMVNLILKAIADNVSEGNSES